jgi:ATP-dependent Clp protease ATP-binding subunit ClpB
VDFKNTIIIMTSNLGSDLLAASPQGDGDSGVDEATKELVMERVRGFFAPELLNRIDEISVFNRLSRGNMDRIVDIELDKVRARLAEDRNISLDVDARAIDWLAERAYDPTYGARPLRRVLQRQLLGPLAIKILSGDVLEGDTVKVRIDPTSNNDSLLLS